MPNPHILQVSQLTQKVRFMLESELNTVWLTGEISNFIAASSGHWYLSLKDQKSQVRCAMFKGSNRRVRIRPTNGQQVLVRAKVSLYEPRGDFQLIIEQMEDAGDGLLRQQYEQLKQQLSQEGLFDLANKQPMPRAISTVGIVTSPTGAAIQDILAVVSRRNPLLNIIIYPCLVQGELAAEQIVQSIVRANQRMECDVLIVGRGGGSLEDLWCFNEESVVRAIAASTLPVISAVGHEIDTTLADFAADVRAPTPSAAAELVSGELTQMITRQIQLIQQLTSRLQLQMNRWQDKLTGLIHRHQQCHPVQKLQLKQQQVDELNHRLLRIISQQKQHAKINIERLSHRLNQTAPNKQITLWQDQQTNLHKRLVATSKHQLDNKKSQFGYLVEQLHMISPLATIARGYSVTRDQNNAIVKRVGDVQVNQTISVEVSDGSIEAKVTALNKVEKD
ncbi:exodeoxyribonuclease VII large subunit [Thalassotalea sp. LPB0316]|uniref:exodeoxyribonuclease VII large subunit n=1 Tax=Thalassotalea sp. LPB0316 TaxID=2769490 RepID=UPI00186828DF|nr:exodeoxyribonuclease VII large subunit [Thalassotalea sp. LPB0316]QOL26982.1 exodeoxyribonuclease VII large subunit [Thalassotalea sp. LPB0316]